MENNNDKNIVQFTQFLRPNGRPIPVHIERSEEVAGKAAALNEQGVRFEIEVLTTGIVHMDAVWYPPSGGESRSIANRLTENDERVPGTVDELVAAAEENLPLWREIVNRKGTAGRQL